MRIANRPSFRPAREHARPRVVARSFELIPNGVDTSVYAAQRVPFQENSGKPVEIVFLGRLDESRKGLDVLLEALHELDRDVRITIMGSGRKREAPGVDFVGRVSDAEKATILGRADIYVAPNLGGESFGIVLVEAMAAGCAVVASDLEAFDVVCDAGYARGRFIPNR